VLFALKEPPLKFEGISVDVADLLELIQNGFDLLGSNGEERIICNLESIDLRTSSVEGNLDDYFDIEFTFEFNENL